MPSDLNPFKRTVLDIKADLANGRTSSRELIEAALAQIADPAGEGARTFVKVYGDSARAVADAQDRLRKAGYIASRAEPQSAPFRSCFTTSAPAPVARMRSRLVEPPRYGD
jgi:aspartyl-tRNA(Asn)/glutamyl-tRNA(Gln) amidotransferase subunit A